MSTSLNLISEYQHERVLFVNNEKAGLHAIIAVHNTELSPAVWQYWFEGVSSDYGDYGWMECEGKDWYVEVSSGNWQKYPGSTASLWHIQNRFD